MPRLIRRAADGGFAWADDRFTTVEVMTAADSSTLIATRR